MTELLATLGKTTDRATGTGGDGRHEPPREVVEGVNASHDQPDKHADDRPLPPAKERVFTALNAILAKNKKGWFETRSNKDVVDFLVLDHDKNRSPDANDTALVEYLRKVRKDAQQRKVSNRTRVGYVVDWRKQQGIPAYARRRPT